MRSRISSSCLLSTLIVLFLQQISLHAIPTFGPLEELEEALEDDWYNWWISWSLELLEDSLSEWSSSKSLKISSLLVWSLTKVLIRDLALFLYYFLNDLSFHCWSIFLMPLVWISFISYRNHFLWSGWTSTFYNTWMLFFSYGISQRNLSLCIWIFSWMGL